MGNMTEVYQTEVFQNEVQAVREQYNSKPLIEMLKSRNGMQTSEDAIKEEARQRCRRNQWAEVTKNG